MHITSNQLLIMTLGVLHFPDVNEAKSKDGSFLETTHERKAVSRKLLFKFAEHYAASKLKEGLASRDDKLKIDFPTLENQGDWHEYFKMQEDGSFLCKKSRLRNLMEEVYQLQRFYSLADVKSALDKAVADVA